MKDVFIDFNVKFALEKVWKWKIWIAVSCVVVAGLTFFLASLIKPEFKSTAAFIPPNISSLNSMVFNVGVWYRGFEVAQEEDIDRTVDYLNSQQVMDSIAKIYKLYDHYGIEWDLEKNPKRDKIFAYMYSTKNKISFSDKSTVIIECYDTDPKVAADIANTILQFSNDFFEDVSQRNVGFEAIKEELQRLRARRVVILDSLAFLRTEYNLYHIDNLGDASDRIVAASILNKPEFNALYDHMFSMELQLRFLEERISDFDREFVTRTVHLKQYPSLIKITQVGIASTYKNRPKRSIIVAIATLSSLIFGIFMILLLDTSKDRLPI